jgi:hypothetical protein
MSRDLRLESESLRVTVRPGVGGTITAIEHKRLGLSVLGTVPWEPLDTPLESGAAPDEQTWLTRYTGGWPLLFPNGGDACTVDGVFHGFHGEASISAWKAEMSGNTVMLERRFTTVPVRMTRTISVEDDVVRVKEIATAEGSSPVVLMWGHHPTFGSDLLAMDFEITTGARSITIDEAYDPPANPLRPGWIGAWPFAEGKNGIVDLRRPLNISPDGRMASLAYLNDFESPWIAIRRLDDAIAVALSWDTSVLPSAWIWFEIGGTSDAPWCGRTRLIGLEPSSTELAYGLAEARGRGARLITLQPGIAVEVTIQLHVFQPSGRVPSVGPDGRVGHRF